MTSLAAYRRSEETITGVGVSGRVAVCAKTVNTTRLTVYSLCGLSRDERSQAHISMPPPPRKAGILPDSELLSGDDIRNGGVLALFKTEPILNRKCVAFYLREQRLHTRKVQLLPAFTERGREHRPERCRAGLAAHDRLVERAKPPRNAGRAARTLGLGWQRLVGRQPVQRRRRPQAEAATAVRWYRGGADDPGRRGI